MSVDDLLGRSGVAQASLLARGEVSCAELTDVYLGRIERENPYLRAFVHVAAARAKANARLWDTARRLRRQPRTSLSGVPMGIKDLHTVRFMPARLGSRAWSHFVAPADDGNVARLRQAGVIILGKLATSEFGAVPFTEPDIHPPTRNPFDPSRTSGGSSGGTATAVAAGLVSVGHGSDGGGSIRIPAALCHLFGFKASRGALHNVHPAEQLRLSTEGPLVRHVEDAEALLQLLAVDPTRFATAAPPARGLRVVLHLGTPLAETDPAIVAATRRVATLLTELGHHVDEAPWLEIGLDEFLVLWRRTLAWVPAIRESILQPVTRWLRAAGRDIAPEIAHAKMRELAARIDAWWGDDVDLHVSPAVACLAPKVGSLATSDPEATFRRCVPLGAFTAVFNVGGQPAMTVPVGVSPEGLPVAVQIAARRGQDALLLGLARQLETALGGFQRWPQAYAPGAPAARTAAHRP